MSDVLLFAIIIFGVFTLVIGYYLFKNIKKFQKSSKQKEKKIKKPKVKISKKSDELDEFRGSYVDISKKFLFRKELKLLAHISRALPREYLVFPKIGVDLILGSIGDKNLYNAVASKYIDMVIFEEATMKPVLAIDTYDGSLGNEQLDLECQVLVKALKVAELPLITIKIKGDYTEEDIKKPIFETLGIKQSENEERK